MEVFENSRYKNINKMPPINKKKKIEKLNQFVKISDRVVYYRMFHSLVLKASYNYIDIEDDIKKLVKTNFNASCNIHYLGLLTFSLIYFCKKLANFIGSRVIGLGYKNESDLDLFIDIGNIQKQKKMATEMTKQML